MVSILSRPQCVKLCTTGPGIITVFEIIGFVLIYFFDTTNLVSSVVAMNYYAPLNRWWARYFQSIQLHMET